MRECKDEPLYDRVECSNYYAAKRKWRKSKPTNHSVAMVCCALRSWRLLHRRGHVFVKNPRETLVYRSRLNIVKLGDKCMFDPIDCDFR